MGTKSSVTNEDILDVVNDLATMVGQGFEGMNQQFARINNTLAEHSATLRDHSTQLTQLRLTTERILGVPLNDEPGKRTSTIA